MANPYAKKLFMEIPEDDYWRLKRLAADERKTVRAYVLERIDIPARLLSSQAQSAASQEHAAMETAE